MYKEWWAAQFPDPSGGPMYKCPYCHADLPTEFYDEFEEHILNCRMRPLGDEADEIRKNLIDQMFTLPTCTQRWDGP